MGIEITDEAMKIITKIVANSISEKVFDGVNWAIVLNDDTETKNEYESIRQDLKEMGYVHGEILRAAAVPNGLIYDIDVSVIKSLVNNLMAGSENADVCKQMIDTAYEQRRNSEFQKLHVYLMKNYKEGRLKVSVALFNVNQGNKITYKTTIETGKYAGKKVAITLNAFALRHWDLQELNRDYLIPSGIKIAKIRAIEILPTCTGVGFNLELVGLSNN
jgi:hypothetical protein